jgi:hypothetical protein
MASNSNGRADLSNEGKGRVSVFGLGGAGVSILDRAVLGGADPRRMIAVDADRLSIEGSIAGRRLLLGESLTKGLGSFGDRNLAHKLVRSAEELLRGLLPQEGDLILVGALGGATGGELVSFLAGAAKERGLRTALIALTPFSFEPEARRQEAGRMAEELGGTVDCLCVLSNRVVEALETQSLDLRPALDRWNRVVAEIIAAFTHILEESDFPSMTPWELCRFFARRGFGEQGNAVGCFAETAASAGMGERLVQGVLEGLPSTEAFPWTIAAECLACLTVKEDPPTSLVRDLEKRLSQRLGQGTKLGLSIRLEPACKDQGKLLLLFPLPTQAASLGPVASLPVAEEKGQGKPFSFPQEQELEKEPAPVVQEQLPLSSPGGRFERITATIYKGENLDLPTFRRRNLTVRL